MKKDAGREQKEHGKRVIDLKNGGLGTMLVLGIAVVYILLGLAFFLIPGLKTTHVCSVIAVLLILAGIIRVGEYFLREYYKNLNEYGFSVGVLLIILGVCTIIKIQQVSGAFTVCLGMGLLLTAIVKVQNAMDAKALLDGRWPWLLGFSCFMVLTASLVLINPFSSPETLNRYTYAVMIIDGVLTVLSTGYLSYSMRHYEMRLELLHVREKPDHETEKDMKDVDILSAQIQDQEMKEE